MREDGYVGDEGMRNKDGFVRIVEEERKKGLGTTTGQCVDTVFCSKVIGRKIGVGGDDGDTLFWEIRDYVTATEGGEIPGF